MDPSAFNRLCAGVKFDFHRFRADAEKLQILRANVSQKDEKLVESCNPAPGKVRQSPDAVAGKHNPPSHGSRSESIMEGPAEHASGAQLKLLGSMTVAAAASRKLEQRKAKKKKQKSKSQQLLADMMQEEVNHLRNQLKIHVYGTDVADPIKGFSDLVTEYGMSSVLLHNIVSSGYVHPTPIQAQAIPVMLQHRQILACAPTGSGKTAAFVIPILHTLSGTSGEGGIRSVALAPTRELAQQTYHEFCRLGEGLNLRIYLIDKVLKALKNRKNYQDIDILVTTPKKLVHLLEEKPPAIALDRVEWLIVDESDKLFEKGKEGFRDQLASIYAACDSAAVRRAMFSATTAADVEEWCKLNLDGLITMYIGMRNVAVSDVEQELVFAGSEPGKLLALRNLVRRGLSPPVLIFVQSRDRAKQLYSELAYEGVKIDVIHSGRPQPERDVVVREFRAGKTWVLVCTEVMGRGIDFKGVNLVINYDFPLTPVSYIHRIGRTGRAGRKGKAITFFTEQDLPYLRGIANLMRESGCQVPEYMLRIPKPGKKARRKLATTVPERDAITTIPEKRLLLDVVKGRKAFTRRRLLSSAFQMFMQLLPPKSPLPLLFDGEIVGIAEISKCIDNCDFAFQEMVIKPHY